MQIMHMINDNKFIFSYNSKRVYILFSSKTKQKRALRRDHQSWGQTRDCF